MRAGLLVGSRPANAGVDGSEAGDQGGNGLVGVGDARRAIWHVRTVGKIAYQHALGHPGLTGSAGDVAHRFAHAVKQGT